MIDDLVTWAGALERCMQAIRNAGELFERRRNGPAWDEMRRAQDSFNRAVELLTADEAAEAKREAERAAYKLERGRASA